MVEQSLTIGAYLKYRSYCCCPVVFSMSHVPWIRVVKYSSFLINLNKGYIDIAFDTKVSIKLVLSYNFVKSTFEKTQCQSNIKTKKN